MRFYLLKSKRSKAPTYTIEATGPRSWRDAIVSIPDDGTPYVIAADFPIDPLKPW